MPDHDPPPAPPSAPADRRAQAAQSAALAPAPDGDGFALFRRAVDERDADAWQALHARYHGLVRAWLSQHALAGCADDLDDLATRAFERFWRAVGPAQLAAFPNLAVLLGYLRRCAVAALLDESRAQRARRARRAPGELAEEVAGAPTDEAVLAALGQAAIWRAVVAALPDPIDRRVVYLACVAGLRPGEIARLYPAAFPVVAEVYRRKRQALARLRRDERLRAIRSGAA
jgi:DNA-directed RNA polymerase specialized sigma24 family protein